MAARSVEYSARSWGCPFIPALCFGGMPFAYQWLRALLWMLDCFLSLSMPNLLAVEHCHYWMPGSAELESLPSDTVSLFPGPYLNVQTPKLGPVSGAIGGLSVGIWCRVCCLCLKMLCLKPSSGACEFDWYGPRVRFTGCIHQDLVKAAAADSFTQQRIHGILRSDDL